MSLDIQNHSVMKKLLITILIGGWISANWSAATAQEVQVTSNDIYLKLNQPRSRTSVPEISWLTPSQEYTHSTERQINIQAEIRSDVPLQLVSLAILDHTSGMQRGLKKLDVPANTLVYSLNRSITLPDASNYLEIVTENANGARTSAARSVLVGNALEADVVAIDRKDYGLLFATDQYDSWTDLVNP